MQIHIKYNKKKSWQWGKTPKTIKEWNLKKGNQLSKFSVHFFVDITKRLIWGD